MEIEKRQTGTEVRVKYRVKRAREKPSFIPQFIWDFLKKFEIFSYKSWSNKKELK